MENQEKINVISINGVDYIPANQTKQMAFDITGKPYQIVRTYSAGVFAGYLKSEKGQEVVLTNARRLWYWDGAASLSQLAMEGVKKPENCKFPCEVSEVKLLNATEILQVSEKAKQSIQEVAIWQQ